MPETTLSKVVTVVGLLLILAALVFSPFMFWNFSRCAVMMGDFLVEAAAGATPVPSPDGGKREEPVTFLLYGVDAGEWAGGRYRSGSGRADTIVLGKVYPAEGRASVLSIPRDTLVEIPGRPGDDKINHAYAFGGPGLLVETVERFTGVPVDYYLGLNYRAFKDIVDLLGGVKFDLDRVIEAQGMRLEKGRQVLNGDQAFAVVTCRKGEPLGDIGRVMRQQRFIKAVAAGVKGKPPDLLFYTMLAAWKNLDTNIEVMEAFNFLQQFQGLAEERVSMAIVPGWFYNRGGISYWRPFAGETRALLGELFQ